ncbi:PMT family glycosyltransferase, 4-amino-4-deoxy-L-arabinose transferase [Mycobacterium sp. JS623]|uniref:galactan 5-O-arabinofuranosyltransferase n=1 Tax=Mycobacterium sp. JS623 TaxID=212767 RepID=UPI0002A56DF1|nr:galactan 5-O-arabinofuranosyltransferase [Mycobacterium sp. JS623]AGB26333.1 PMT family glycosyltransferase, 4-amino-4-deoxy-L-arabinose transferase [Mycobacterium sp. JS623]
MRGALAVLGQMAVAVVVAVVVAAISLVAIARVEWPAYNSSNQLHALTTVGQFGCLAGLLASGWVWRRGRRLLARVGALVFLSGFAVVTLGMPLGATKLYLFGISVDQQFRTEYMTRLADTAGPHDMTYYGLPPFYPPGWFWLGGRFAALTGTPAWEMFKPWAITSIAIAVVLTFVLWASMIRFEYALIVSIATTAAALAYSPAEPYSAIIAVLLPAVFVLAWSGLRGATRGGGWAAVIGVGIFLGVAALFYTLLFGYAAFTLAIMGLTLAVARRRLEPLTRLVVIAVLAGAIGLIGWGPYLIAALNGHPADSGTAQHYLPADGAELSFPMLQFTLLGGLCMVGALWLAVRVRSSTRAGALAIAVLAVYAWSLLSMLTTLARTTLLSFRLQPTLTVLLAAAGTFGFVEAALAIARRYRPEVGRRVVVAAVVLGSAGALGFTQDIPNVLKPDIVVAYTDTDADGHRADRRPPGAEQYYREIDAKIQATTGQPRNQTVVLTADYSFLSYYPYYGFQGLTSHYANPLAQFDERAKAIESWATLTSADQFVTALDKLPWKPPTVFLMRRGANDTYTLRLAADVYPNQPNVRRYHVTLDKALFDDPRFAVSDIGPFVLAIRKP